MLDPRGHLLRAAVGFAGCSMPSCDRALHALRTWLDPWAGIGHVTVGMHRQGFDLQLTQYDGLSVGADAVARDAAGGVGGVEAPRSTAAMMLA
jgi:hypothetical protein